MQRAKRLGRNKDPGMNKLILNTFILLLTTTAVLSCSAGPFFENANVETDLELSVSGTASDISTGTPLEDIKVTIHVAEHGQNQNMNLVSKTAYTDNNGKFTISAEGFTNETTCLITAEDPDGMYADASQEIKIQWSSVNMEGNVFYVNDCDFYLEKKK